MVKNTEVEIIFFSFNTIYSKVVQEFTNSKWGHVGVITRRENGKVEIHEALNEGLVVTTYNEETINYWLQEGTIEFKKVSTSMTKENVRKRANSYIGRPYGWTDILVIILFKYFRILKIEGLLFKFTNANKLICSEFVSRLLYDISYKSINFQEEYNKNYSLITPADIYNSSIWLIQDLKNIQLKEEDIEKL